MLLANVLLASALRCDAIALKTKVYRAKAGAQWRDGASTQLSVGLSAGLAIPWAGARRSRNLVAHGARVLLTVKAKVWKERQIQQPEECDLCHVRRRCVLCSCA